MQRQLLLDTETTGFKPSEGHRIIEFAAVEMINNKLTGKSLHLYFNPERNIPFEATKVHGITIQQVQNKPVFSQCVNQILQFINGAELIIHNAKFDVEFLDHHFLACGKNITLDYVSKITDSLQIARNKFPGAKNSLDALCDRFNVDRSHRGYHSALLDCELLAKVYLKLLSNEEGNNSVADYMPRFTGNKCPECGHNMLIKTGKYGEFEGCSNFPECKYIHKSKASYTTSIFNNKIEEKCPDCNSNLVERDGKFGKFIGCGSYPRCKYIKPKSKYN